MFRSFVSRLRRAAIAAPVLAAVACANADAAVPLPDPLLNASVSATAARDTAVLAGGCFWGIEAVYRHVKGVITATSGYAGGEASTAKYELVGSGTTGHAEAVQVIYDPSQVTYGQLLKIFFSVAHDPTQLNRQGPDVGTHYRSAIFYSNPEQQRIAQAYIAQLTEAKSFPRPIVTRVDALDAFYRAEDYHQNYAELHPNEPYIAINDLPKVARLKKQFAELYR
jgi:peptide-methionine (S)-S-oxide reductase